MRHLHLSLEIQQRPWYGISQTHRNVLVLQLLYRTSFFPEPLKSTSILFLVCFGQT